MTPVDVLDYPKMTLALLQRFRYTREGYRCEIFREAKSEPEERETRGLLAARLGGSFNRWIEVAEVEKTFEELRHPVLVKQFLVTCSSKLETFLKERNYNSLQEVAAKVTSF